MPPRGPMLSLAIPGGQTRARSNDSRVWSRSLRVVVIGGEDRIQLAPGVGQDLLRLRHLCRGADLGDLHGRHGHSGDQPAQFERVAAHAAGHVVPRCADLVGVRGHVLAPLAGQQVALAPALGRLRLDQALVLQLLEGRVDRPGTGLPHAAAALGDLLDQLVAVPGLLGQQGQRSGADVATADPRPAAEPTALTGPRAEPPAHRAESGRAERAAVPAWSPGPPAPASTSPPPDPGLLARAPALVLVVTSVFVMFMHQVTPSQ